MHRVHKPCVSLSQISLQRADFHPISKNLIRCVSFLPRRTHHNSFPPHGSIASTDRSIKILHGINVIRYVNKRYVVGCVHAWSQLNHGAYTQSGWEKNSSSSYRAEKFLGKVENSIILFGRRHSPSRCVCYPFFSVRFGSIIYRWRMDRITKYCAERIHSRFINIEENTACNDSFLSTVN